MDLIGWKEVSHICHIVYLKSSSLLPFTGWEENEIFFATSGENRLSISFSKKDCAAGLSEPGKCLFYVVKNENATVKHLLY